MKHRSDPTRREDLPDEKRGEPTGVEPDSRRAVQDVSVGRFRRWFGRNKHQSIAFYGDFYRPDPARPSEAPKEGQGEDQTAPQEDAR